MITFSTSAELSAAITLANTSPDTILFTSSISLIGPLPAVSGTYTIDGDNFRLTGAGTHRGFLILGATASPTILDLNFVDMLALGGDGGEAQDVRGGSDGGGLGARGAIYVGNFANATLNNVTFDTCVATGGSAISPAGGGNSGGGGGLGGDGGRGSGSTGGELIWNISSGTVTFANPIEADTLASDGGIEKFGIGTLNLSGLTNIYRGSTKVTTGILQYSDDTNLGSETSLELNGGIL